MAGVPAGLPPGIRISDHISLGVIARAFPPEQVQQILAETGKASERERDLPAQVMVYYAIALALYMGSSTREVLRCLLEGLRWLWGAEVVRVAGKSGISQARSRLGEAPLRRLYEEVVRPIATHASKGAWVRDWRLVSLDGSCLEVADTAANRSEFGVPGASRGASAFPQLRFVVLVENGTHVLFGARLGPYAQGETTLAREVLAALRPGMLCMADERIATLLLDLRGRLHQAGSADGDVFQMPMTQQEIADHLGLTLVHVNRVLRRLREAGIVTVQRGVVKVDEMARLSQLAAPLQDIYERATREFGGQAASP